MMENKNLKFIAILVTFLLGLVTLMLSYFEAGAIALMYQLVSLFLLSVSVILFYMSFMAGPSNWVKTVSVPEKKPEKKVESDKVPKVIVEKDENEDFFKKNIISIDLDEDEENLTDDEKKVIKTLRDNDGSMQQKDVTEKVFKKNKVKSHRVISSLIKKDYVIKRNEGKTNKIFLKR